MIPISPIIQELVTHHFGNDIYAMELILQNAIDPIDPGSIITECLQKILRHVLSIQEFVETLKETVQWKDSEEKYHKLFDSFSDALFLVDMKGRILDVNQACLAMFGYSRDEIKKLIFRDFTPEKWRDKEEDILQNQILKRGYSNEYEKENIKKDGSVFYVSQKTWLIKNKHDESLGMWVAIRDIAERRKAEKGIIEDLLDLQGVVDKIEDGVTLSDSKGHFAIFNTRMQEITGYTMEDINKQDLGVLLYPNFEDWQKAIGRLNMIIAGNVTSDVETKIKTKDGLTRIVSVSTSLIKYKGSEMFLSIWRDITDFKIMQKALEDSEVRFRRLFEAAQDGILILDAGTGQIREVNPYKVNMLD
jgi:PAS domain S-box-containing protein